MAAARLAPSPDKEVGRLCWQAGTTTTTRGLGSEKGGGASITRGMWPVRAAGGYRQTAEVVPSFTWDTQRGIRVLGSLVWINM